MDNKHQNSPAEEPPERSPEKGHVRRNDDVIGPALSVRERQPPKPAERKTAKHGD